VFPRIFLGTSLSVEEFRYCTYIKPKRPISQGLGMENVGIFGIFYNHLK
jgi:hypothetical protein